MWCDRESEKKLETLARPLSWCPCKCGWLATSISKGILDRSADEKNSNKEQCGGGRVVSDRSGLGRGLQHGHDELTTTRTR
jgi:hypothetical protein